jgi:hypothetical protein
MIKIKPFFIIKTYDFMPIFDKKDENYGVYRNWLRYNRNRWNHC